MAGKGAKIDKEIAEVFGDAPKSSLSNYEFLLTKQLMQITQTINLCSSDVLIHVPALERELDALDCLVTNMLTKSYIKVRDDCLKAKRILKKWHGNAGFGRPFYNAYLDVLLVRYRKLMEVLGLDLPSSDEIDMGMVLRKERMKAKHDRSNHKEKTSKKE